MGHYFFLYLAVWKQLLDTENKASEIGTDPWHHLFTDGFHVPSLCQNYTILREKYVWRQAVLGRSVFQILTMLVYLSVLTFRYDGPSFLKPVSEMGSENLWYPCLSIFVYIQTWENLVELHLTIYFILLHFPQNNQFLQFLYSLNYLILLKHKFICFISILSLSFLLWEYVFFFFFVLNSFE